MPRQRWQQAEDDFQEHWRQFGKHAYCFAFHDTREAMGATGSRRVYTSEQPADFLVTFDGQTFFAEVKSSQNATSFPLADLRASQTSTSIVVEAAGGQYFFFLKNETEGRWYQIPGHVLVSLRKAGIKSVKWGDLKQFEVFNFPGGRQALV